MMIKSNIIVRSRVNILKHPLLLSAISLLGAVAFNFPFIPCSLSEKVIQVGNYSGTLISEGFCFSLLFYYFIDYRPRRRNTRHASIIAKNKIEYLKLGVPFYPDLDLLGVKEFGVKEFLELDLRTSFFEQLKLNRLPGIPEYIDEWLSDWRMMIAHTFTELQAYHQYFDIEFYVELERVKKNMFQVTSVQNKILVGILP